MITSTTLHHINNVTLTSIVQHYVKLKHTGSGHNGNCPFHAEKTGSFMVNNAKNIFKCFGCGAGGRGAVNFIMQHDKITWLEAVKKVATLSGITIEYEIEAEPTEAEKQAWQAKKTAASQQEQVLNYVVPIYQQALQQLPPQHPAKQWLASRKITDDVITAWGIGWAPNEWNTVTTSLINLGLWDAANALGVSKHSDKAATNYDGYRSRIIFPVWDNAGRPVGLGGRYIKVADTDAKEIPKYINPADCELYNKSTILYDLNSAADAIKQAGKAFITEGYLDVITPHIYGLTNTVASCGTAITDQQFQLLKRHTNHLVFFRDNDSAGWGSFYKYLPQALKFGFRADVVIYDGKDPDAYFTNHLKHHNGIQCIDVTVDDAIITYAHKKYAGVDDTDLHGRAAVKQQVLQLLACIDNEILRNNYFDTLATIYKWKVTDTKKEFEKQISQTLTYTDDDDGADEQQIKFAPWMSEQEREHVLTNGYIAVKRKEKGRPMVGYYSFSAGGKTEITNFIVNPLFRIEAGKDSRYLSEVDNGYTQAVIDLKASSYPSIDQFQGECVAMGGSFLIYGSRNQWLRIASDLLRRYPSCAELITLGWQVPGFFTFIDRAYIPGQGFVVYDKWGMFEHNKVHYFLPAASIAYKKNILDEDDPYENLRFLAYRPVNITFSQWATQMHLVYKQKGIVGIAYALLSLIRDIVFSIDNNCPHLYGFGEPSSGKSKWAESITALFFSPRRSAWNLNSGTDYAFSSYVAVFKNCPAHENEFDIEVINLEWFQQIKGWYDGESRIRGKLGKRNATESQKIVSTIILTGQKLVTADDNSVVTRSIIEGFSAEEYTDEASRNYDKLKELEAAGLNGLLIEVLDNRQYYEQHYRNTVNDRLSKWRKNNNADRVQLNQRILQNYAQLSSIYRLTANKITLPQPVDEFDDYCYQQAVKWSKFIRKSDTLSEFWRTLEFLANQEQAVEYWDYVVQEVMSLQINISRTAVKQVTYNQPTRVLFIRINNIHKLFQQAYRTRTGKEAMNMENLLHYFSSRTYYVGPVYKKKFYRFIDHSFVEHQHSSFMGTSNEQVRTGKKREEKVTSCYAFLYDELDIDIASQLPGDNGEEQTPGPF